MMSIMPKFYAMQWSVITTGSRATIYQSGLSSSAEVTSTDVTNVRPSPRANLLPRNHCANVVLVEMFSNLCAMPGLTRVALI